MKYKKEYEELRSQGWTIVRNFFSPEEVQEMRRAAMEFKNENSTKDLLSSEHLKHLCFDKRIHDLAKEMIQDRVVYFGDTTVGVENSDKRISHGFHKDSADRTEMGSDFKEDYSIIRFGFYLQDHDTKSAGLIVRSGSHRYPGTTKGKSVNVPSCSTDVVIWYLTTTHSGHAKRLKWAPNLVLADDTVSRLSRILYYRVPSFMVTEKDENRIAIFMTFGKHDEHLKKYIDYLKSRGFGLKRWQESTWQESDIMKMQATGYEVWNLPEEVGKVETPASISQ